MDHAARHKLHQISMMRRINAVYTINGYTDRDDEDTSTVEPSALSFTKDGMCHIGHMGPPPSPILLFSGGGVGKGRFFGRERN